MLELTFDFLPPSSNHALQAYARGRRVIFFPSPALKELQNKVWHKYPRLVVPSAPAYRTEYEFHFPMYNKSNGLMKKKDLTNMIKYLEDSIFKVLYDSNGHKIDDSLVIDSKQRKRNAPSPLVIVRIFPA